MRYFALVYHVRRMGYLLICESGISQSDLFLGEWLEGFCAHAPDEGAKHGQGLHVAHGVGDGPHALFGVIVPVMGGDGNQGGQISLALIRWSGRFQEDLYC